MPFSGVSSRLRNQTWVLHTAGRFFFFFTIWATWEAPCLCICFVYNSRVMWLLAWNPLPSCSLTSTCNVLPRTKFLGRQKRSMTLKSESVRWAFFLTVSLHGANNAACKLAGLKLQGLELTSSSELFSVLLSGCGRDHMPRWFKLRGTLPSRFYGSCLTPR